GRRIGLLYQMLDDLLDYCPSAQTGKAPLRDYQQQRWTWLLAEAPGLDFGLPEHRVLSTLHRPATGRSPMMRSLLRFEEETAHVCSRIAGHLPSDQILGQLMANWVASARGAVEVERDASGVEKSRLVVASTSLTDLLC